MARIRTIKPEFWTSEQIVECSTNARLLFVGLWNFSDDDGRHSASVKNLKAQVFPADSFTPDEVQAMVDELIKNGLVDLYETPEGACYWQVTGWHHQKIDRPNPSKFPPNSTCTRRSLDDRSTSNHPRKGMEGKVKEGNVVGAIVEQPAISDNGDNAILTFPCNGSQKSWHLTQAKIDEWTGLYPGIDILAECRKALAYVQANRPKTARGMPAYLVAWFNRTNNGNASNTAKHGSHDLSAVELREKAAALLAERKQQRGTA